MLKTKLSAIVSVILQFPVYAATLWRVRDKLRNPVAFILNPPQQLIWAYIVRQIEAGKPIRLRILKARQQGISMFCRLFILFWILLKNAHQAISIANRLDLPQQWVRQSKALVKQLQRQLSDAPRLSASNKAELWFEELDGSRYLIGSSEGETPGMGDTLNVIHCSEIASWKDPDGILTDLLQAVPPTMDTAIIQESTGRAMGDWWFQRYYEAKEPDCEFDCVFIPWYMSPEYDQDVVESRTGEDRHTWDDLGKLNKRELGTLAYAERYQAAIAHLYKMPDITPGQMMWRRKKVIDFFHGDEDLYANQYPACETEAFLSEGRNVFTEAQVRFARDTERDPVARYDLDLVSHWHPRNMTLQRNDDSGELVVFEKKNDNHHYVIGADCQWGATDRSDFDALFVQCLETDRVVARCKGRYDLAIWGKIIAGLGWYYNTACVAPERNAKAANSVMPLLLGKSSEWRYPNIYVRSDKMGIKVSGPKGFGWYTDEHTKGELFSFAKTQTLATDYNETTGRDESRFDWCDSEAVEQMRAYIWDDMGKMTAPVGAHDDLLMARVITALVSHYHKPNVDLYIEKPKYEMRFPMTTPHERLRWMAERGREDYEEYDGFET